MSEAECVAFLQWALPRLRLRWAGFRKVRRQVCRRIERRRRELELRDLGAYRAHLEAHSEEWRTLETLCRVTISRFYRDRGLWQFLEREVLAQARSAWSAGCASGEEPYTLALVAPRLAVVATDADPALLARARAGCYGASSLKELPEPLREHGFVHRDGRFCVVGEVKRRVSFAEHDVRAHPPAGRFDLVLCRNLAFTYFDDELQREVAERLVGSLRAGGALAVGAHERVPDGVAGIEPWSAQVGVYRRVVHSRR